MLRCTGNPSLTSTLSTYVASCLKQNRCGTLFSKWNYQCKTSIRKKHYKKISKDVQNEGRKAYLQFSQSARFILIDHRPIDNASYFNKLDTVHDINANVVATSCKLHWHLRNLKNQTSVSKLFNADSASTNETDDVDNIFLSKSEFDSLSNLISPSSNSSEIESSTVKKSTTVKSFILEDAAKSITEWNLYFKQLQEHSNRSLSLLFQAVLSFFIDVAELKSISISSHENWLSYPLVQSFVRYLVEDDKSFQFAQPALAMYLQRCLHTNDIEVFYVLFNKIHPKIKVYNNKLLDLLVKGLSNNHYLKEARDLLALQKQYQDKHLLYNVQQTQKVYGVGCFNSGDLSTGIKIMIQRMQTNGTVDLSLVKAFLDKFSFVSDEKQWKENKEVVLSFFNYLKVNEMFLDYRMVSYIVQWFSKIKSENWSFGTFQNHQIRYGDCPITKTKMKDCQLTSEEFNYLVQSCSQILLKNAFQEDISLKYLQEDVPKAKSSLIYQSSIKDIRKFLEHMHDEGPFDLIVDGMNSVYFLEPHKFKFYGKHKHQTALHKLKSGLLHYKESSPNPNLKICLIFRKHMFDIVRDEGKFLFDLCDVHFAHSSVSDDILMLYGSMSSGPNCYFASHDLFRNYRVFIEKIGDSKLARLFDKYQCSRQIFFKNFRNRVTLSNSSSIEPEIKYSGSSWHFPYFHNTTENLKGNLPSSWLCITKGFVHPHFKYALAEV